jgi:hypothetical protein
MIYRSLKFLTIFTLSIHSINADSFQEKNELEQNHDNFIITLQKELRTPEYRKSILPNDFSYLLQLITFGTSNNQPPVYLRSTIKLFSNMLKSSQYVNAHAFSHLLEALPSAVMPYFSLPTSRHYITDLTFYDAAFVDRFKSTVQTVLYSKFSTEYETFKQDPDLFLKKISNTIVTLAEEEMIQEQLRQSVIKFCEIALSKLIWNPAAGEQTWLITKRIGEQLATLLAHNILDDSNDLDDLHWTLLNRYCYFIELTATDLPESFYKTIKNDLRSHDIVLFALEEQDYMVESKLSYMQRTLLEAETAAYCYKSGIAHV